jgi:hypothetical protein
MTTATGWNDDRLMEAYDLIYRVATGQADDVAAQLRGLCNQIDKLDKDVKPA